MLVCHLERDMVLSDLVALQFDLETEVWVQSQKFCLLLEFQADPTKCHLISAAAMVCMDLAAFFRSKKGRRILKALLQHFLPDWFHLDLIPLAHLLESPASVKCRQLLLKLHLHGGWLAQNQAQQLSLSPPQYRQNQQLKNWLMKFAPWYFQYLDW